jgi:hypothetical protein
LLSIKSSTLLKDAIKSSSVELGFKEIFNFVPAASPIPVSHSDPVPG